MQSCVKLQHPSLLLLHHALSLVDMAATLRHGRKCLYMCLQHCVARITPARSAARHKQVHHTCSTVLQGHR